MRKAESIEETVPLQGHGSNVEESDVEGEGYRGTTSCLTISKVYIKRHWKKAAVLCVSIISTVLATLVGVSQTRNTAAGPTFLYDGRASGLQSLLAGMQGGQSSMDFGIRMDSRLQDCQETYWKLSFPNIDYALFGYDILKGYPLATGHDPGLTHPIFMADYSSREQTSDCRYSVPKGFITVPDVSCVMSFSSKVIKNKLDMSSSLEASVNVEGGGWGVSFSASTSYKQSMAKMSSGEFLYVISQARCHYYYSMLDLTNPPPFHPGFLNWAKRLAAPDVIQNDVIQFIKYYGTHFLSGVTFGARFVKKHTLNQTSYEKLKEQDVSVEAQASYSGLFSVGGGFSLGNTHKSAVSSFDESVETSTITVGAAPPSDGDAMTWASTVHDNPVPTHFKLLQIHDLFTDQFAQHFSFDFTAVRKRLQNASKIYCEALKEEGVVHSCESSNDLDAWQTILPGVYIDEYGYKDVYDISEHDCKLLCLQEDACVAVDYMPPDSKGYRVGCFFHDGSEILHAEAGPEELVVFLPALQRLKRNLVFNKTRIKNNLTPTGSVSVSTTEECSESCAQAAYCRAFVMCNRNRQDSWCATTKGNCYLYNEKSIDTVVEDDNSELHFMWKNLARGKRLA